MLKEIDQNIHPTSGNRVMINCSKFVCSKNLLDTILLLLDSIRAIIIFLVNWSTAVLNLLSCRINWIRAIDIIMVNCSNCRPLNIRTVDTNIKTDINFAQIAINRQIFCFKNMYGRNYEPFLCVKEDHFFFQKLFCRFYIQMAFVSCGPFLCVKEDRLFFQ